MLRRLLAFWLIFSVIPAAAAVFAALRHTGSHAALAGAAWSADARFVLAAFGGAALGSMAFATILGLGSLLAWRDEGGRSILRVARLVAVLWLVAMVLYPGFGAWIPVLRALPWWGGVAVTSSLTLASALPRALRPTWREVALTVATAALFFVNLSRPAIATPARAFTERDVVLVGFDSMSYADAGDVMKEFTPSSGSKVVFTNAWTPVAMTSTVWRTVLSGQFPSGRDVLPGVQWPRPGTAWLPHDAAAAGYQVAMFQDAPATNVFLQGEHVTVPHLQGWKSIVDEFAWKLSFPLSVTGARWWVSVFGGPADEPGRYAYDHDRYRERMLGALFEASASGPVLWATHSCYVHAPIHLTLTEARGIDGWWKMRPPELEGSGNPFFKAVAAGGESVKQRRAESVRASMREMLERLQATGILGHATVFVLTDHGQRDEGLPVDAVNHVVLAAFLPGPRGELVVDAPVSLADVAPTIRERLGFPPMIQDGRALPLDPQAKASFPRNRVLPRFEPLSERTLGIDLQKISSGELADGFVLESDGTFVATKKLLVRLSGAKEWVE